VGQRAPAAIEEAPAHRRHQFHDAQPLLSLGQRRGGRGANGQPSRRRDQHQHHDSGARQKHDEPPMEHARDGLA